MLVLVAVFVLASCSVPTLVFRFTTFCGALRLEEKKRPGRGATWSYFFINTLQSFRILLLRRWRLCYYNVHVASGRLCKRCCFVFFFCFCFVLVFFYFFSPVSSSGVFYLPLHTHYLWGDYLFLFSFSLLWLPPPRVGATATDTAPAAICLALVDATQCRTAVQPVNI